MSARSDQQAASSPLLHATADITAPAAIVLVAITGTVDAAWWKVTVTVTVTVQCVTAEQQALVSV
eukprot:19051-Heterococcus_DN1.PRE.2